MITSEQLTALFPAEGTSPGNMAGRNPCISAIGWSVAS